MKSFQIVISIILSCWLKVNCRPSARDLEESATKLLKFSENNPCVAKKISYLEKNCQSYLDDQKSKLAFHLTNCLLKQSKKQQVYCSKNQQISDCTHRLKGDTWTTFSNFYLHIDNLCYYYKSLLWEQDTENLINSLSKTTEETQNTLHSILKQSTKMHSSQMTLHEQIKKSIKSQKQLETLISQSANNFSSKANQISELVMQMAENMTSTYQALKVIIVTLEFTMKRIYDLQKYLMGEYDYNITSLIFLVVVVIIIYLGGTIPGCENSRIKGFFGLLLYLLVERFTKWVHLDFPIIKNFERIVLVLCILILLTNSYIKNKNNKDKESVEQNLKKINQTLMNLSYSFQKKHQFSYINRTAKREQSSSMRKL